MIAVNNLCAKDMSESLEARFSRFLISLSGTEVIDSLQLPEQPIYTRKADFLLANRKVVVELKALTTDPSFKIDQEVDKHRGREEFPLIYGQVDLRKVLDHLPDGEKIRRRILNAIGRMIEDHVRSAEEQIEHTRRRLGIPDAVGVLVLLNESIALLDPTVIAHRVLGTSRRQRSGRNGWLPVDFCLIVDESNLLHVGNSPAAFVNMWVSNRKRSDIPWFDAFGNNLTEGWSRFNNMQHVDGTLAKSVDINFTPTVEASKPSPKRIRRQDLWSLQYEKNPYLRTMLDEVLLDHGSRLLAGTASSLLVGGPDTTRDEILRSMEKVTHFMDEMSHRGLDWRRIPKRPITGLADRGEPI